VGAPVAARLRTGKTNDMRIRTGHGNPVRLKAF
jgi:hypothetical protein